ncbi:MAG: hypothetical protein D6706_00730 [Chloroflexi bacterium]|nr:MAG: hypothetical protein D6706_00730 [Chloroflexota bacterium]
MQKRTGQYRLLLLLASVLFLLAACGGGGDGGNSEPINYVTYESPEKGITFEYPEGWATNEVPGGEITIASDPALLDDSNEYEGGAIVTVFAGPADAFEGELTTILDDLVLFLMEDDADQVEIVNEVASTTINGHDAASVTLSGREAFTDVLLKANVMAGADQIVFVAAMYDDESADKYEPIMDHILNSVELSAPSE